MKIKMNYTVRMYTGKDYLFKTFTNRRKALHMAFITRKIFWEVTVLMNAIDDDFGIIHPDKYGVIREYTNHYFDY